MDKRALEEYFVYSLNKKYKNIDYINTKVKEKIVWKCTKGHVTFATYTNYYKNGCKNCRKEKYLLLNSLEYKNPLLAIEWDSKKNSITPDKISSGAAGKFYWICTNNHSFLNTINNRKNKNIGCPYCSGRLISNDTKTLVDLDIKISKFWGKNNVKSPNEYSFLGNKDKYFWWKCTKGGKHEFKMKVSKFLSSKNPCQRCNRQELFIGVNDFQAIHPNFAAFWDDKLNKTNPNEIHFQSKDYIYFKCPNGFDHSTLNSLKEINKFSKINCQICKGNKVIYGVNDLYSSNKTLMKYWSVENIKSPKNISMNSNEIFLWNNCKNNHIFERSVKNMKNNQNCPYCSGVLLLKNFNDFKTYCIQNSEYNLLLDEWDYDKNKLQPDEVTYKYSKNVYWKCKNLHEFEMRLSPRINRNSGCVICNKSTGVSKTEIDFYNKISKAFPQYEFETNNRIILEGLELDLFDSEQKIAIEYNGDYWHDEKKFKSSFDRHERKMLQCNSKGILLIIIWESYWLENQSMVINDIAWMIKNRRIKFEYTYDYKRK